MTESNRVADALQQGAIPWRLPTFPRNILSRRPYGGVTPIMLQIASADALGGSSTWWGTVAEWASVGSKVPFGIGVRVPGCSTSLHNMEFTDRAYEPPPLRPEDPDRVFGDIIKGLGVKIEHGFDSTCKYFGAEDKIRIPHRFMFEIGPGGASGWFDALGHELFHATEPRVKWDSNDDVAELRSEIGSGSLMGMLGVKPLSRHLARHHDAHSERWARQMRADPLILLKVCDNVTATVTWLLGFAGTEVAWHDATLETPHALANSTR